MAQPIPNEVLEYARLHNIKRQLNEQLKGVNQQLQHMNLILVENMKRLDHDSYDICPTTEEESSMFGASGVVKLKARTDFEVITRENLIEGSERFYRFLLPEEAEETVKRLGQGVGAWIWNNRRRTSKYVVERVYRNSNQKTKRKATAGTAAPKKPKKPAVTGVPTTRDEFMAIPALKNLVSDM